MSPVPYLSWFEIFARKELAPRAAEYEAAERFPREVFRTLGQAGLLGLPYAEEYGGGGQPYEVYLQVVEELARNWLTIGLGVVRALPGLLRPGELRHRASRRRSGCRTCSAATSSARTACPSRSPAPTRRR